MASFLKCFFTLNTSLRSAQAPSKDENKRHLLLHPHKIPSVKPGTTDNRALGSFPFAKIWIRHF